MKDLSLNSHVIDITGTNIYPLQIKSKSRIFSDLDDQVYKYKNMIFSFEDNSFQHAFQNVDMNVRLSENMTMIRY